MAVVGTSGAGKSTLAASLARRLSVPHVELDGLFHLPGWVPRETGEFRELVGKALAGPGFVVDGNYTLVSDLVLERADTVIWLDLPRYVVMAQVMARSLRRVVTRQELWNGNRETWSNLLRLDPERSIVVWSFTRHAHYKARYEAQLSDPEVAHLRLIRLRSRREARLLAGERW